MSLFASNLPIDIKYLTTNYQNFDSSKFSSKSLGVVKSYSANTHQGTVRDYNEDRVSIILNIVKPTSYTGSFWPKCSFFGVYDGHGGPGCAEFLRDNLHHFVIKNENFPVNPKEAIIQGFKKAEYEFISKYAFCEFNNCNDKSYNNFSNKNFYNNGNNVKDRSGSCAIVALIVDDLLYVANVGDSRAVLSKNKDVIPLSNDHKPDSPEETKRIEEAGGKIYQTQTNTKSLNPMSLGMLNKKLGPNQVISGPSRVFPGRLSVSRSFGDVEAKTEKLGGNPNVIIYEPEVTINKINSDYDYVILGCDGIFDQISNNEISEAVNLTLDKINLDSSIHNQSGLAIDMIIKTCLARRALDNITCVFIGLENWVKIIDKKKSLLE